MLGRSALRVIGVLAGLALTVGTHAAAGGPQIHVEIAWARALPKVVEDSEFYMIILNAGDTADRLIAAHSSTCGMVGLYDSHTGAQGAMGMRPIQAGFIEVPAQGRVELKAGGLHLMCMRKKEDLRPGVQLLLMLKFEKSGEIMVPVSIREQ